MQRMWRKITYGWVLNALYTQSALGNLLVLKGGNGLRKAFLPNTRFSKAN
jgi:predicted nucleotidyltransferase component of viral defense system